MHPASLPETELLKHCTVRRQRRSGPGGQHRNKVETAIFIEHKPTGVSAEACERRSQEKNRQAAIFRLRVNLALEFRSDINDDQPPSKLWKSRCRGRKLSINPQHDDFPAILAEALDHIHVHNGELKPVADRLECSATQLVKLLAKEPRALAKVNALRPGRELKSP